MPLQKNRRIINSVVLCFPPCPAKGRSWNKLEMKIAIEGCAHGELETIYNTIACIEQRDNYKVDLLICCGDFQSTRNESDLQCMAIPQNYKKICSFYKYYSGEKIAPVLTLFIGGNHEASNYLQELAFGGWVAPNIYYLGYAGIVNFGGVRIAGLSGIYKGYDYMKGHFEQPPYSKDTLRSVYHIRNVEVFRLIQTKTQVDICLSHDWPRGVYNYGFKDQLLKKKPFSRDEVNSNTLGSPPCEELLNHLKPSYWFAAHLHVKFAALVVHDKDLDDVNPKETKFLALDKCLPHRQFLQVLDIPQKEDTTLDLEYDLEWLTILHLTNHLTSISRSMQYLPSKGDKYRWDFTPTTEEISFVKQKFGDDLKVPHNFSQTVDAYTPSKNKKRTQQQPNACINPQTLFFCDRLGLEDPMAMLLGHSTSSLNTSAMNQTLPSFLTPERPGDFTNVSLSECAAEIKPKRLSLTLPSPKKTEEDVDESVQLKPRLSLSLPEPTKSKPEEADSIIETSIDILDIQVDNKVLKESAQTLEVLDLEEIPSCVSTDVPVPGPQVKKFKRRNQAMYTSMEED